ncbi:hypothetical protein CRG98_039734 [Punica granatum]|uniref:RING-type domain-containing protein n=1 Tax=Punica granatum TaxID=22663 RepID=A0A2I0I7B7_PUNGR|nr:hypothetical protein CRG98_039734 [Punica granatum]
MPLFYYGIAAVASVVIVVSIYNLIVMTRCIFRTSMISVQINSRAMVNHKPACSASSSFQYKLEEVRNTDVGAETKCTVCLSTFEDEDPMRQLPRCNHLFHAACIEKWLGSSFQLPNLPHAGRPTVFWR